MISLIYKPAGEEAKRRGRWRWNHLGLFFWGSFFPPKFETILQREALICRPLQLQLNWGLQRERRRVKVGETERVERRNTTTQEEEREVSLPPFWDYSQSKPSFLFTIIYIHNRHPADAVDQTTTVSRLFITARTAQTLLCFFEMALYKAPFHPNSNQY